MKAYPLFTRRCRRPRRGLVLPVSLVGGPIRGVVNGAEQVGAARLELELGSDVTERKLLLRRRVGRLAERV